MWNWLARNRTSIRHGKFSLKTLIWENQHHFLIMFIRVALKENARLARILRMITNTCSNQGFLLGFGKLQETKATGKPDAETISIHGPMTWKVMQRNAWKDVANWRIKQLNNYTKSRRHVRMTTNLNQKKLDQWENCLLFAHKVF